jgi:hypothetical protein
MSRARRHFNFFGREKESGAVVGSWRREWHLRRTAHRLSATQGHRPIVISARDASPGFPRADLVASITALAI